MGVDKGPTPIENNCQNYLEGREFGRKLKEKVSLALEEEELASKRLRELEKTIYQSKRPQPIFPSHDELS